MTKEDILIFNGNIVFWDLDLIDINKSVGDQLWELKEDMLLIHYPNEILLDLGWYTSSDEEGYFKISIIKDKKWQMPLERYRFTEIELLVEKLNEFCRKCKKYSELK